MRQKLFRVILHGCASSKFAPLNLRLMTRLIADTSVLQRITLKFTAVCILNDIVCSSREELVCEMYTALPNVTSCQTSFWRKRRKELAELDCEINVGRGFAVIANRRLIVQAIAVEKEFCSIYIYIHAHTCTYIYIVYIYMCTCARVRVCARGCMMLINTSRLCLHQVTVL